MVISDHIIDLNEALKKGNQSTGVVYIAPAFQVRPGKKDFIVGDFESKTLSVQFRSWEDNVISSIVNHGKGLYIVEVVGSEFGNMQYLNIRQIFPYTGDKITVSDFRASIPAKDLKDRLLQVLEYLKKRGLSAPCYDMVLEISEDPSLQGKFYTTYAAIKHHDNIEGGLCNHTTKMLRILSAIMDNNMDLRPQIDLLTFSIFVHDIGKVYEYDEKELGEFWYANHRVRGIEFLTSWKDRIIAAFSETFYRQVQSVIAGHHGEYGDRPSTVAAAMVHFIDLLESQITELAMLQSQSKSDKISYPSFGNLQCLPKKK